MRNALAVLTLILIANGPAHADPSFDDQARGAVEVNGAEGLAALYWSQLAQCKGDDDFTRRQCEGVREARRARVSATTFLVTADGALDPAPFNEKAMSVDVEVRACAACKDLGGERRALVGRGPVKVVGGRVRAAPLHVGTRTFKTRAEGKEWVAKVAPRLRADFLVRIPAQLETWREGGISGYRLEVVGFRVVDACTGEILWSRPTASRTDPDPDRCSTKSK